MEVLNYILVAVPALVIGLYFYFTRTFNYWKSRGVKGPKPVPFFGNIKNAALRKQYYGEVYHDIYKMFPNEKVVGLYRMTTPALLLRDLDVIKDVMIKDFDMFVDRGIEFSKEGLGANLLHSDGETWRVLRTRFTPLFTTGKLKNMLYLMTERGNYLVDYINEIIQKTPEQEIHLLMQKYTMATIAACAFGLDVDTINQRIDELRDIDKNVFTLSFFNEFDLMYPGILKRLNTSLFPKSVASFFYNLVRDIVRQRNGVPTNRNDFMDLILEMKQQGLIEGTKRTADDKLRTLEITEDVMAAQAFIFYVAGYETSATTMGFMMYELAKNPDIQEKLIAEIDKALEKHNGNLTYETMKDMPYIEKVMNETLRCHTLVEPLQRNAQADLTIPGTNVTIKKGQTVLVSATGIHQDEKYYPDPERFDPERFSIENSKDRHSCAFIPFGTGPRNCVGMRFAKFQIYVCITKFFSNFRVQFCENTKPMEKDPWRPLLGPKGGITLKIVKR